MCSMLQIRSKIRIHDSCKANISKLLGWIYCGSSSSGGSNQENLLNVFHFNCSNVGWRMWSRRVEEKMEKVVILALR